MCSQANRLKNKIMFRFVHKFSHLNIRLLNRFSYRFISVSNQLYNNEFESIQSAAYADINQNIESLNNHTEKTLTKEDEHSLFKTSGYDEETIRHVQSIPEISYLLGDYKDCMISYYKLLKKGIEHEQEAYKSYHEAYKRLGLLDNELQRYSIRDFIIIRNITLNRYVYISEYNKVLKQFDFWYNIRQEQIARKKDKIKTSQNNQIPSDNSNKMNINILSKINFEYIIPENQDKISTSYINILNQLFFKDNPIYIDKVAFVSSNIIKEKNLIIMNSTVQIEMDNDRIYITVLINKDKVLDNIHFIHLLLLEMCRIYQLSSYKISPPLIKDIKQNKDDPYQLYEDNHLYQKKLKKIIDDIKDIKILQLKQYINDKENELQLQKEVIYQIENHGIKNNHEKDQQINFKAKKNPNIPEEELFDTKSPQELLHLLKHFLTIKEVNQWVNLPRTFLKHELKQLNISNERIENILENVRRLPDYTKAQLHAIQQQAHDRIIKQEKD